VAEVLKLTNNEGVDVAFNATYVESSFVQSASVVKRGGKWLCVENNWGKQHEGALAKCQERGAIATNGDYGRYLFIPAFVTQAHKHFPHMLASCDKLYAEGVHVRATKVIPFGDLEKVQEEVLAVGNGKRSGSY
jgi:NADPH:quinone reductase-like Zn-dependent oxidoreductase